MFIEVFVGVFILEISFLKNPSLQVQGPPIGAQDFTHRRAGLHASARRTSRIGAQDLNAVFISF
jgi:hypothetical protein